MSNLFTNVKMTSEFANDLSETRVLYGFDLEIDAIEGSTEGIKINWVPLQFDPVTKKLSVRLGFLNINVKGAKLYYGYDATALNKLAVSFNINTTLLEDIDNIIVLDLSSIMISAELRGKRGLGNTGLLESSSSYIDEHYHITEDPYDQYDPNEFIDVLRDSSTDKLNSQSDSSGVTIGNDGFYNNLDKVLDLVSDGSAKFLGVDLEDVYLMNDYKVNLLGKNVQTLTDVTTEELNGLVINTPTAGTSRELGYVNLPSYLLYHQNTVPESATSFNNLTEISIYKLNNTGLTDGPINSRTSYTGLLQVLKVSDTQYKQSLSWVESNDGKSHEYERYITNGSAGSWINILDENNLINYLTYDLVIKSQDDVSTLINRSNESTPFKNIAFVDGDYDLTGLSTLNVTNLISGFNASINVQNLRARNNSKVRLENITINYTSSNTSGAFTAVSGFDSVSNVRLNLTTTGSITLTAFENCKNLIGVTIDSTNVIGTVIQFSKCDNLLACRDTYIDKPTYNECTHVDPYTCQGAETNTSLVNGYYGANYSVSYPIAGTRNLNNLNSNGTFYLTGNLSNAPSGVTSPVIIEVLSIIDKSGSPYNKVIQRLHDLKGYTYTRRIIDEVVTDWVKVVVEDNAVTQYNIYSKKSQNLIPIKVNDYKNISLSIGTSSAIGFYALDTASNKPSWTGSTYGKIHKTDTGYIVIATNGLELAVGTKSGTDFNWRYLTEGFGRPTESPLITKIGDQYSVKNAYLGSLYGNGCLTIKFPQVSTATFTLSILVGSIGGTTSINMSGTISGQAVNALSVSSNNGNLVTGASYGAKDGLPTIALANTNYGSSTISVDLLTDTEELTKELDVELSSTINLTNSLTSEQVNSSVTAYNVTNQIAGSPISSYLNVTDKSANKSDKVKVSKGGTEIAILGVSRNSDGYLEPKAHTIAYVTAAGQLKVSSVNATSALEKKENINPFNADAIDIINNTQICEFNFKDDPNKEKKVGFIADVTDERLATTKHDSMDYGSCIGVLMKAVQELNKKIDELKNL